MTWSTYSALIASSACIRAHGMFNAEFSFAHAMASSFAKKPALIRSPHGKRQAPALVVGLWLPDAKMIVDQPPALHGLAFVWRQLAPEPQLKCYRAGGVEVDLFHGTASFAAATFESATQRSRGRYTSARRPGDVSQAFMWTALSACSAR